LQGITPDQAIGRLVAHDVVDDVSNAWAAALDERFEFRDSLILRVGGCEHKEALLWKTDQANRLE
jgi:hypothetical protein